MPNFLPLYATIILFAAAACGNTQQHKNGHTPITPPVQENRISIKLLSPASGQTHTEGAKINISCSLPDTVKVDSTVLFLDDKRLDVVDNFNYKWNSSNAKLGTRRFRIAAYKEGKEIGSTSFIQKIITNDVPKQYTYKVVKEYPHSRNSYTQGLYFHNGYLYEGTGLNGKSALQKTELNTGEILQSTQLSKQYFGEGVCYLDGKIYQLTWETRKGFIYDAETFEKIGEFAYPTEGWGITTDGKELIMSDGTSIITFMSPQTMTKTSQIEAYDNKGPVKHINELEYINGEIWANVYTTDEIVRIDPATGKIKGVIDLSNILDKSLYKKDTDVLNGIAYDAKTGRIFVTGKRWPTLFEIKIIEK